MNVQATSKHPGSILVKWSPIPLRSVNGKLLGYKIYYKIAWINDVIKVLSASSTSTEFFIGNLQLLTEYHVEVAGFTRIGVGVKSRPVYSKTGILLLLLLLLLLSLLCLLFFIIITIVTITIFIFIIIIIIIIIIVISITIVCVCVCVCVSTQSATANSVSHLHFSYHYIYFF